MTRTPSTSSRLPRARTPALLALAVSTAAALTTACGEATVTGPADADEAAASEPAAGFPRTVDNCGQEVTIPAPPERVVLLAGGTIAESSIMIELGLADRIVGTNQGLGTTDDPAMQAEIDALPKVEGGGADLATPSIEQVLDLEPDLVLASFAISGDDGGATRDQLDDAGIPNLVTEVNCSEADGAAYVALDALDNLDIITFIGEVFGVEEEAAALVDEQEARYGDLEERLTEVDPVNMVVTYSSDASHEALQYTGAGGMFGDLIERSGGENIAAEFLPGDSDYANIGREAAATLPVELLVVGMYNDAKPADEYAAELFELYPEWPAARTGSYVAINDGISQGLAMPIAIEKIARVAHPERFAGDG